MASIDELWADTCYVSLVFVVVLAAETDRTGQSIAFLIACLLAIACTMAALTIWYWRFTSPKRVAERMAASLDLTQGLTLVESPVTTTTSTEPILASRQTVVEVGTTNGPEAFKKDNPIVEPSIANSIAISEAVRRVEAGKPEPDEEKPAKGKAATADDIALHLKSKKPRGEGTSVANGDSITDEAWDRITQSMLDNYRAEKSDT